MFGWFTNNNSGSGAIDVVAVRDASGTITCSPFHVKLNRARRRGDPNRVVNLAVNSRSVALSMKLGAAGEAFFVERTRERMLMTGSPAASLLDGSPATVPAEDTPAVATLAATDGTATATTLTLASTSASTSKTGEEAAANAASIMSPASPAPQPAFDSLSITSDRRCVRLSALFLLLPSRP